MITYRNGIGLCVRDVHMVDDPACDCRGCRPRERRQQVVRVTPELLSALVRHVFVVPDDTRVVGIHRDIDSDTYDLHLESGAFERVPEGMVPPRVLFAAQPSE